MEWMETLFDGYYVRGIYDLFYPLNSLSTTIASINNDVFIATTQKIVLRKENRKNLFQTPFVLTTGQGFM